MKKIFIGLIVLLLVGVGVFYYVMNKPHRDIKGEETIKTSATQLFEAFNANEATANTKYLNKALEVSGIVAIIDENQDKEPYIVLKTNDDMYGIMCTLRSKDVTTKVGDNVSIKGYCSGFLGDVKLTDCVIANKK